MPEHRALLARQQADTTQYFPPILTQAARLPAVLMIVVLTLIMMALTRGPLSPDISGQLWMAHQIRMGARIYVDIPEINPPLWFWAAIPMDWLAQVTGIRAEVFAVAAVGLATVISLTLTGRLLDNLPTAQRQSFLVYAALILFVMPVRDIGQREHYAMIWALPYVVLAVARRRRATITWPPAIVIGAAAGLGFALKHYFLGVPILIELWLLFGMRRDWRPLRPETLVLAGTGLTYAATIVTLTPEYLTVMVPQLQFAYGPMGILSWRTFLLPAPIVWIYLLRLIAPRHRVLRQGLAPLTGALLVAASGFFLAFLLQRKGWAYQGIPTSGFIALAFATALYEGRERAKLGLMAVLPLLLPFALAIIPTHPAIPKRLSIDPVLAGLRKGDAIALVSTEGPFFWPSTADRGFLYSGRYSPYWMLAAIEQHDMGDHDPRARQLGAKIVAQTIVDLRCEQPHRIIFHRTFRTPGASITDDPMSFFMRDAGFREIMTHYRLWKRDGVFDAYERVSAIGARPTKGCRRNFP